MTDQQEDYDLWFAELKKQEAEKLLLTAEKTLERVKSRATNLLGWMITLTVAMGTVSISQNNPYKITSSVMCMGFLITAIQCVRVLYSTQWKTPVLTPDFLQDRKNKVANTKAALINDLAIYIYLCSEKNMGNVKKAQKIMRLTWCAAVFTPIFAIIIVILTILLPWSWALLHAWINQK